MGLVVFLNVTYKDIPKLIRWQRLPNCMLLAQRGNVIFSLYDLRDTMSKCVSERGTNLVM